MTLDALDLTILRLLQQNNQRTAAQLATEVPLSPTAIQRRIRLLRERGIIEADVSIVSAAAAGRPFSMLVLVSLERERMDIIDRFKQAIRNTPEVMNGYYVTGETDFVLVVTARDMNDYEAFTRRFFYENPDIKGFKTLVVMDRIKTGHQIPLG